MQGFITFVQSAILVLFFLLLLLVFVAFTKIYQLNTKVNRLKRRYDILLRGRGELNLEELLNEHGADIEENRQKMEEILAGQENNNKKVAFSLQKIGFQEYDAFPDLHNKLSYTLVMLDSSNNGIMITSIFGRENSASYAKYVKNGRLEQEISPEEQKALEMALSGEMPVKSS